MLKHNNWIFNPSYYTKKLVQKELATWSHEALVNHVYELRTQLNNLATQNKKEEPTKKLSHKDYQQAWSYPNKIKFLIEWQNKPLTSLEIQKLLIQLDKRFKNLQRPVTTLSGLLTRTHKSKRICRYKVNGKAELYFILPSWVDKQGDLKSEWNFITT
jgi:hypothetical protein